MNLIPLSFWFQQTGDASFSHAGSRNNLARVRTLGNLESEVDDVQIEIYSIDSWRNMNTDLFQ